MNYNEDLVTYILESIELEVEMVENSIIEVYMLSDEEVEAILV